MRIRIIKAPPFAERHGVTVGSEFETCEPPDVGNKRETWIVSEDAERVRILPHEFEEVGDYGHEG